MDERRNQKGNSEMNKNEGKLRGRWNSIKKKYRTYHLYGKSEKF